MKYEVIRDGYNGGDILLGTYDNKEEAEHRKNRVKPQSEQKYIRIEIA